MHREYFEKIPHIVDSQVLKDLTALNIRTLQKMSFIRPDELLNNKNPDELIAKSIRNGFNNFHEVLDYWEQVLSLGHKTARSCFNEARSAVDKSENIVKKQANAYTTKKNPMHASSTATKTKSKAKTKPKTKVNSPKE